MAPVKPMGLDTNPKTREGVTGFPQDYNQEPSPSQDLNPDAVVNPAALPKPSRTSGSRRFRRLPGARAKGSRKKA